MVFFSLKHFVISIIFRTFVLSYTNINKKTICGMVFLTCDVEVYESILCQILNVKNSFI